ncbi:hypothetical protein OAR97_01575 [Arcobacteraceae bacterium]|nr:hypothetical protein [Arcobacteraceae bacterium]
MKIIIALEEMIKNNENVIKSIKKQLSNHDSGISKLTFMGKASAETNLENAQEQLERHTQKLKELMTQDMSELEERERVRDAIERKNYLKYQKVRIKRDVSKKNDEKLEAMLIIDELKEDSLIEDRELFEIASKVISLNLSIHCELESKLSEIKNDFEGLLTDFDDENIKDLGILNTQASILILHFHVLLTNIKENIEEDNLPPFRGFPKFEDWWIVELWSNHHAYYALFKWKGIISKQCITDDQKKAWELVFSNWISFKKILSGKGVLAYHYNYAFDTVMRKYSELEEELATSSLESMSELTQKIISKEDFSVVPKNQKIITNYVLFKREKLNYKDVKKAHKLVVKKK